MMDGPIVSEMTYNVSSGTLNPTIPYHALVLAHLAPWTPGSNLAARVNRAINDRPAHTTGCHERQITRKWYTRTIVTMTDFFQ